MGRLLPFDDPADYVRARQRIQKLWDEGQVQVLPHAQKRMKERRLDMLDLQNLVKYGRVTEHSHPRALWRYRIEGSGVDGNSIGCLVEIDGNLLVITVLSGRQRNVSRRR